MATPAPPIRADHVSKRFAKVVALDDVTLEVGRGQIFGLLGVAAATSDGTATYLEMSHPLASLDDAHDFNLAPGEIVGLGGFVNLFSMNPSCNVAPIVR